MSPKGAHRLPTLTNRHAGGIVVVLVTVLALVAAEAKFESQEEDGHVKVVTGQRDKRSVRTNGAQQSSDPTNEQLSSILEHYENGQGASNLLRYTPSTPSPAEVNCHVEISMTRLVGGKCVNLGSFTGCQAGIYLALDDECNGQQGVPPAQGGSSQSAALPASRGRWRYPFHRRRGRYNN